MRAFFRRASGFFLVISLLLCLSVGASDQLQDNSAAAPGSDAAADNAASFLDSASAWAVPELTRADALGLIPEDLKTKLTQPITRLEFAEICVALYESLAGEELAVAPASTFKDTRSEAARKAYAAGIVQGTAPGIFSPNDTCTREQIATMLHRLIPKALTATGVTAKTPPDFVDKNQISSYAKDAVDYLSANKLMNGVAVNLFYPKGACTVEMALCLSVRIYEWGQDFLKPLPQALSLNAY